jgi:hypothetical protein
MTRSEFIHREILNLSNRIEPNREFAGDFVGTIAMTHATRVRLAIELADEVEKSGQAPWGVRTS